MLFVIHTPKSNVIFLSEQVSNLLLHTSVTAHELINTTGCVNQLALTSIEGVRGVTDFQLDQGIGLALKLDCLGALCCRAAQEHIAVAHVLEHYGAIVVWMDSFFHFLVFFCAPEFPLSEGDKELLLIILRAKVRLFSVPTKSFAKYFNEKGVAGKYPCCLRTIIREIDDLTKTFKVKNEGLSLLSFNRSLQCSIIFNFQLENNVQCLEHVRAITSNK
jgi:hypothetical protein